MAISAFESEDSAKAAAVFVFFRVSLFIVSVFYGFYPELFVYSKTSKRLARHRVLNPTQFHRRRQLTFEWKACVELCGAIGSRVLIFGAALWREVIIDRAT